MAAINLKPTKNPYRFIAEITFLNVREGTVLHRLFSDKLMNMWNEFCQLANAEPDGLICAINKWAEDNNISGESQDYTDMVNDTYFDILDKMTEDPKFQVQMRDGTRYKMKVHMIPDEAGAFDVEIVIC